MTDLDIFHRINALSAEEEQLYKSVSDGAGLNPEDAAPRSEEVVERYQQ